MLHGSPWGPSVSLLLRLTSSEYLLLRKCQPLEEMERTNCKMEEGCNWGQEVVGAMRDDGSPAMLNQFGLQHPSLHSYKCPPPPPRAIVEIVIHHDGRVDADPSASAPTAPVPVMAPVPVHSIWWAAGPPFIPDSLLTAWSPSALCRSLYFFTLQRPLLFAEFQGTLRREGRRVGWVMR